MCAFRLQAGNLNDYVQHSQEEAQVFSLGKCVEVLQNLLGATIQQVCAKALYVIDTEVSAEDIK